MTRLLYLQRFLILLSSCFHDDIPYILYKISHFRRLHTGDKTVFLTNTVADSADFMIAAFVGDIFMVVNKAGSIKNDMVMNMVLVSVGTNDIFIFPF